MFNRKKLPSIAVIIPVHRVIDYVPQALASVSRQSYPAREIILVDDGNTPELQAQLRALSRTHDNITLLELPHGGTATARHRGVEYATADAVIFLDADDELHPDALQHFARTMRRNPHAVGAYGRFQRMSAQGDLLEPIHPQHMWRGHDVLMALLYKKRCLAMGSFCVWRHHVLDLGPVSDGLSYGEDWVLWCHLAHRAAFVPATRSVMLYYRQHPQSVMALTQYVPHWQKAESCFHHVYNHATFRAVLGEQEAEDRLKQSVRNHRYWLASECVKAGDITHARYFFQLA